MTAVMHTATTAVFGVFPNASLLEADMGCHALEYALREWAVFPLTGKNPFRSCPSCRNTPRCTGPQQCGHDLCHGVLDATADPAVASRRWGKHPTANIGGRVPEQTIVLDVDPRHGGHRVIAALEARHGKLPATLAAASGRGDGGTHQWLRKPWGKLTGSRLRGSGIDLKTSSGYTVLPPSVHPDTGKPYQWVDLREPVAPPRWLTALVTAEPAPVPVAARGRNEVGVWGQVSGGDSIADYYSAHASWADVLTPHGWVCLDRAPDADGARWRHPDATSAVSATVRHGCLFCYSTSTVLPVTEVGDPHGITRFRAYALFNHAGDLSAAARTLRERVSA